MPQPQLIYEICEEIKNYFINPDEDIYTGEFTISGGNLSNADYLKNGQYFRIKGSALNDGVWQYPASGLVDETFNGAVWAMRLPPAFIALAADIEAWEEDNAQALSSPYQSESFGGYSYSLKSGASADSGSGALTWRTQFDSRLNKWRRLFLP